MPSRTIMSATRSRRGGSVTSSTPDLFAPATSTIETSATSAPPTSSATRNVIFSPASVFGPTPLGSPDGLTNVLFGPALAPANLSARQAAEAGLLTSGTFGPLGSISSTSAALQRSLASRLLRKTASIGSILYRLTWKGRDTPLGRRICALRASVRRTSGNASFLSALDRSRWPTPTSSRGDHYRRPTGEESLKLSGVAKLASWPTPRMSDGEKAIRTFEGSLREIARKGAPQARRQSGADGGLGDASRTGLPARERDELRGEGWRLEGRAACEPSRSFWSDADWLSCRDGTWRPVEPGSFPLAHGATSRVGRLRAYGNAINPYPAAGIIEAFVDIEQELSR